MLSVSATPSLLFEHLPSPGYSTEAKGKGFQFIVATGRLYDIELSVLEDALEYWMWTEDQPPIPQDRHFSVSDMRRGDWLGLRFRPWFQEWKDRTGPGKEMMGYDLQVRLYDSSDISGITKTAYAPSANGVGVPPFALPLPTRDPTPESETRTALALVAANTDAATPPLLHVFASYSVGGPLELIDGVGGATLELHGGAVRPDMSDASAAAVFHTVGAAATSSFLEGLVDERNVVVEAWVRVDSLGDSSGEILAVRDNGRVAFSLQIEPRSGGATFSLAYRATPWSWSLAWYRTLSASRPVPAGIFQICAVLSSTSVALYLDGELLDEASLRSYYYYVPPHDPALSVFNATSASPAHAYRLLGELHALTFFRGSLDASSVAARFATMRPLLPARSGDSYYDLVSQTSAFIIDGPPRCQFVEFDPCYGQRGALHYELHRSPPSPPPPPPSPPPPSPISPPPSPSTPRDCYDGCRGQGLCDDWCGSGKACCVGATTQRLAARQRHVTVITAA